MKWIKEILYKLLFAWVGPWSLSIGLNKIANSSLLHLLLINIWNCLKSPFHQHPLWPLDLYIPLREWKMCWIYCVIKGNACIPQKKLLKTCCINVTLQSPQTKILVLIKDPFNLLPTDEVTCPFENFYSRLEKNSSALSIAPDYFLN